MWLPRTKKVIWTMKRESQVPLSSHLYNVLNKYIDLDTWRKQYGLEWYKWLNEDVDNINDIKFSLNKKMIEAVGKANNELSGDTLFYWFDIDRTHIKDFKWEKCPISKKKLVDLGSKYHSKNRLISPSKYIVFPVEGWN
jgi:hypothetical protein